jgi:hypothetical protein
MNDNRNNVKDRQTQLPTHFLVTEKWFDFFSVLPGFNLIDVRDQRGPIARPIAERRQFAIQSTDGCSFIHVTVFRF